VSYPSEVHRYLFMYVSVVNPDLEVRSSGKIIGMSCAPLGCTHPPGQYLSLIYMYKI